MIQFQSNTSLRCLPSALTEVHTLCHAGVVAAQHQLTADLANTKGASLGLGFIAHMFTCRLSLPLKQQQDVMCFAKDVSSEAGGL